jgi:hypothetical protein
MVRIPGRRTAEVEFFTRQRKSNANLRNLRNSCTIETKLIAGGDDRLAYALKFCMSDVMPYDSGEESNLLRRAAAGEVAARRELLSRYRDRLSCFVPFVCFAV